MMLHISVDPTSGPVNISVFGESCTINSDPSVLLAGSVARPSLPPAPVAWRRPGSVIGMMVVGFVALFVGAAFSSYKSSNVPTMHVDAGLIPTSPRTPPTSRVATPVPPSDPQGERVEQALTGRPVLTPPPNASAKSTGNPFGLE